MLQQQRENLKLQQNSDLQMMEVRLKEKDLQMARLVEEMEEKIK